jgi:hypothetical protein
MEGEGGQDAHANANRRPIAWVRPNQARNREQPGFYDEFESVFHHTNRYGPSLAKIKSCNCKFQNGPLGGNRPAPKFGGPTSARSFRGLRRCLARSVTREENHHTEVKGDEFDRRWCGRSDTVYCPIKQ